MSQIDTSQWKEFKVGDIFEKITTKKLPYKATQLPHHATEDNLIPLVTAGVEHQGRSVYAPKTKDITVLSNCLTISANGANSGATFYQDKPFSILQDAYAIQVKSSINENVSKYEYCFLASIIGKRLQQNDWTNKATWNVVKAKEIKLPVDSNGDPDWQYMDTYIAKLTALAHKNVSSLKEAKAKPAKLNIDQWGKFKISDWFDIRPSKYTKKNGKVLKNAELFDGGNNPVIVNSNTNNGIGGYTSKPLTEQGNVITYSDTTDGANTIFYQAKPFVGYSHVKVILPKLKLSQATMIYLTSIIISAIKNQKYDFSYKLTTDKMLNTIIKLPIDAKGEPDWEYMDNQVRHLATLSNLTIASLRSVI